MRQASLSGSHRQAAAARERMQADSFIQDLQRSAQASKRAREKVRFVPVSRSSQIHKSVTPKNHSHSPLSTCTLEAAHVDPLADANGDDVWAWLRSTLYSRVVGLRSSSTYWSFRTHITNHQKRHTHTYVRAQK
jgi:hypothetical protein